eukprot:6201658-Pleurochrysis_carterae.AAC.3
MLDCVQAGATSTSTSALPDAFMLVQTSAASSTWKQKQGFVRGQMLTLNVQAEAQHVLAVVNDLRQKKALPAVLVEDVGGTPKQSRHRAHASGAFVQRLFHQAPGWR